MALTWRKHIAWDKITPCKSALRLTKKASSEVARHTPLIWQDLPTLTETKAEENQEVVGVAVVVMTGGCFIGNGSKQKQKNPSEMKSTGKRSMLRIGDKKNDGDMALLRSPGPVHPSNH